ncbi:thioredoxin domain-containing protein [Clostridium oryzae]|uniref:Spermatogenesis-associated protein 20-like TRX domain-containing protein n=1 Tax=Clostridium oryzae TaxID=1450648 RepID=A0A1V4IS95_9CLOT|nr:thioredoxin domain-containing protein [Clostridium oryzae]OPJ62898.1 hypothetical protein CLORY_15220 [Clostridium oryzae]
MPSNTIAPNRLINEKSPYLLQHAHNPVDWYPWCDEAFEKAKTENKPIFLSIGYSTCHWCHVMERESFEDEQVAKLMNDTFVCIKVDREERPEIDNLYMSVCQAVTGSGGWPLTIFMTYDKKPFFAGTYIPKESRYASTGMLEIIDKVNTLWRQDRSRLIEYGDHIMKAIDNSQMHETGDSIGSNVLDRCYEQLSSMFDDSYGGFGRAPKFPTPHNMLFLLRYYKKTGEKRALDMVLKTLDAMYSGGIFDQIGYGFHRYSTDRRWLLPHFEKMLYDQALIAYVCVEAYQLTVYKKYKDMAEKIFAYLIRDMKSDEGCFYSAEDADSEGEEGKFYVWSIEQIKSILDKDEAEIAIKVFNMKPDGNFKDEAMGTSIGTNILHLNINENNQSLSNKLNMPVEQFEQKFEQITKKLQQERQKRVRPFKDDKILTDWNSLIIAALAKAGRVFGNKNYTQIACIAADFLVECVQENGRLMHRFKAGDWDYKGNIDDYAFFIHALLELFETTFDTEYLRQAVTLNDQMLEYFWDKENGGFYFTPNDDDDILMRTKEVYDGAVPSGNSVALLDLIKLSRITGDYTLEQYADKLQKAFSNTVKESPISYTQMLVGIDYLIGPSYDVVICGDKTSKDTIKMLSELNSRYIPNMTVILYPIDEEEPDISHLAEHVKDLESIERKATAYICRNSVCNAPTIDIQQMLKYLNA